jgi:hypothetical protein
MSALAIRPGRHFPRQGTRFPTGRLHPARSLQNAAQIAGYLRWNYTDLIRTLQANNLVDEYRMWTFPGSRRFGAIRAGDTAVLN